MAYAHVQSTTSVADNAVATSSVSFASTPTVGNLVVVGISQYRATTFRTVARVTDNQTGGNFYQEDIEDAYATAQSTTAIYSCKVATASGTFTITVTPARHGTADHYIGWGAAEFSGTGGANMPTFRGAIPGAVQSYSAAASGTISRTTEAGSIWVVMLSQSSSGSRSYTIADSGGLTWSDVVDGVTLLAEGTTNNAEAHMWWAYDSAGGARTATVTLVSSTSTFVLTDLEMGGLDTGTPGDKADVEVEGATSTAHSHTAVNTSSNGGIGLVWATSESGNTDYTEPVENNGWSKMLGATNANRYLMMIRRTNGAVTGDTGSHNGATARQMNSLMVFFKAASAVTPWADKNGTSESTTGDANVTASAANTNANALVVGVATVLNVDTDINISDTPPTGTTQITFVENASATIGHSFVYKIVTASETSALQWTHDNTSQSGWNAVIQTYRDDAGGGGGGGATPRFLCLLGAGA